MGQEQECKIRWGGRALAGKALLETDHLLFRGDERLKVRFQDLKSVKSAGGILRLEFEGGPAELHLGDAAEKWARKILAPPSRLDKLGVKAGAAFRLVGAFDAEFRRELKYSGAGETRSKADLVFFAAKAAGDLDQVGELAAEMKPDGALWVVYPKGVKSIREIEAIEAGRAAGLKDVKVARFSDTHTALKFVIPLDRRPRKRMGA